MANDTSRIKDLTPITTVSDSDVIAIDGANGTKGITFEDLSIEMLGRLKATVQEIKTYLNIS